MQTITIPAPVRQQLVTCNENITRQQEDYKDNM